MKCRSACLPDAFVVRKEEQFIPDQTPADISAKLIQPEFLLPCKKVSRVERFVAEIIENAAVKIVCSRFRDRVDDCTDRLAVLRRVVLLDNLDFLDAVHADAVDA